MKKVYLFMFVGIIAIIVVVAALMTFNPQTESWGSMILGAAVGFLIVMSPRIIGYFKARRKKAIK